MRRTDIKTFCAFLVILAVNVFFPSSPLFSEEKKPLPIYVGIFPIRIHQLELKAEQFQADFYLWFRWKGPKKLPGFELMNGDYDTVGEPEVDDLANGDHYEAHRIKGTFFIKINLRDYPFDRHALEIQLENQEMDRTKAVYVPDMKNMTDLARGSRITGWQTIGFRVYEQANVYKSNFGREGEESSSTYSQWVYEIRVARNILPYIIKYSIPLFVIVFMAFTTFFVYPTELEVRAGIGVTSILSAVAFHISQADALPEVGYLVTADNFFIISYIACGLSLVETIIDHMFVERKQVERALKLDHKAKILMPFFYVLSFGVIILSKL